MKYQELLEGLQLLELTAIYNAVITKMPQGKTIQSFHTKPEAVKRLMWLISESKMSIGDINKLLPEDTIRQKISKLIKEQEPEPSLIKVVDAIPQVFPVTAGKKVRMLVDKNPKRPHSLSYDRFSKYKDGMTVAEALKAGITKADLAWDQKHNHIKLED